MDKGGKECIRKDGMRRLAGLGTLSECRPKETANASDHVWHLENIASRQQENIASRGSKQHGPVHSPYYRMQNGGIAQHDE